MDRYEILKMYSFLGQIYRQNDSGEIFRVENFYCLCLSVQNIVIFVPRLQPRALNSQNVFNTLFKYAGWFVEIRKCIVIRSAMRVKKLFLFYQHLQSFSTSPKFYFHCQFDSYFPGRYQSPIPSRTSEYILLLFGFTTLVRQSNHLID